MNRIKVLIVEDDLFVAKTVEVIINKNFPLIEVVGKSAYVEDAFEKFNSLQPNLLILDIELADGDGFELLKSLKSDKFKVIFISAHTNLLINAVKFSLVEFVQKPFSEDDFVIAMDKVVEHFFDKTEDLRMEVLFENLKRAEGNQQIFIETEEGGDIIEMNSIEFGEALSQGAILHMDSGEEIKVFRPLRRFESMLEGHHFYRCHAKYVVNYQKIQQVGEEAILLQSGARIPFDAWRTQDLLKLVNESKKRYKV